MKYGVSVHSARGTLDSSSVTYMRPEEWLDTLGDGQATTYTRLPGTQDYMNYYLEEELLYRHHHPCSPPETHSELAPALGSFGKDVPSRPMTASPTTRFRRLGQGA